MARVVASFFVALASVSLAAWGGPSKLGGRVPTLGGGPVVSQHAVKYEAEALKAQNVPELTTDNKNTLVLKHPGKLLLSASSIWDG
jgi:hypothetical protein